MTGPGAPTPPASIEVFYSYAHEDEGLVKELRKHLSILKRQGVIRDWYDREITAGTEWKGQIDQHLNSAGVILLLVSADFLASDYCYDVEMTRALERHDQGEARVIPVLLRPVEGWQRAPFGKLQSRADRWETRDQLDNRDEAFTDVARGIRQRHRPARGSDLPDPKPDLSFDRRVFLARTAGAAALAHGRPQPHTRGLRLPAGSRRDLAIPADPRPQ